MKLQTIITLSIATVLAGVLVENSFAAPVTGWGTETGAQNGSAVTTDDGLGNFTMAGANLTGNDAPRALFSTVSLGVGDSVALSGSFTFTTNQLNNQQFRFGLFNNNGSATGTLSSGQWTGANPNNWLGYFAEVGAAAGASTIQERNNPNSANAWHNNGGSTVLQTFATAANAVSGTYSLSLTLTLTTASQLDVSYVFNQTAGGAYASSGSFSDPTPSVISFDAAGIFLNGNDGNGMTPFTFNNMAVTFTPAPVPEPAALSMIGLGFGALVVTMRRRKV